MENKSTFQRYGAPIVVLVGICLVISAALALTYSVAAPRIEERAIADATAARQELLADADSFRMYYRQHRKHTFLGGILGVFL